MQTACFDIRCTRCPRLAKYLSDIRGAYPGYHARPVPAFGDPRARLLIVGLAPGLHGANRTGRPFTGDHAGVLLYRTLHKFGFASRPESLAADDSLQLRNCRITNAVKCIPPQNKPATTEIITCNRFLHAELTGLLPGAVILALGRIAHFAVLRALKLQAGGYAFKHGAEYALSSVHTLIDSYHCSRYNTQTRRLTPAMFERVISQARRHVDAIGRGP